jgi:hypothetical protein
MKDMLALFKRDAEYDHQNVDDGMEATIFSRTRVLTEEGGRSVSTQEERPRRKAGSLGFRRERAEDSVYGRR